MIITLIAIFAVALILRFPIAFSLGLACLGYVLLKGIPLIVLPMKMYSGIDVFVILSVPGFILAGNLMNTSGISVRLINFVSALIGFVRGGLGMVNIGVSLFFAEISGSAVADVAALGSILIPEMKRKGYPAPFAAPITSSSASLASIRRSSTASSISSISGVLPAALAKHANHSRANGPADKTEQRQNG